MVKYTDSGGSILICPKIVDFKIQQQHKEGVCVFTHVCVHYGPPFKNNLLTRTSMVSAKPVSQTFH